MQPHPSNRGSHCLPPCCACAHMDAMVDRERFRHHSQRVGWARRGIVRHMPAPRTPPAILSLWPFWAAREHAVSAVLAGLPRVS